MIAIGIEGNLQDILLKRPEHHLTDLGLYSSKAIKLDKTDVDIGVYSVLFNRNNGSFPWFLDSHQFYLIFLESLTNIDIHCIITITNTYIKSEIKLFILCLLCQIGWVTQSFFEFSYFILALLWLAEFTVPYYAESHTQTHFHSEHIEERFGLLTIIVLGESVLASTNSFITLIEHFSYDVLLVTIGCLFTLFGIWWLYFNNSVEHKLRNKNIAFQWGYGHYLIFGSAAAIGALVSVNVDVITNHASIELSVANFGFAVAVALYLIGLWFCQERIVANKKLESYIMLVVVCAVIILGLLPHTILTTGILIVATVVYRQYRPL